MRPRGTVRDAEPSDCGAGQQDSTGHRDNQQSGTGTHLLASTRVSNQDSKADGQTNRQQTGKQNPLFPIAPCDAWHRRCAPRLTNRCWRWWWWWRRRRRPTGQLGYPRVHLLRDALHLLSKSMGQRTVRTHRFCVGRLTVRIARGPREVACVTRYRIRRRHGRVGPIRRSTVHGPIQALRAKAREALSNRLDLQQLLDHLVHRLVAVVGVFLQRLSDHLGERMGQVIDLRLRRQVLHEHLGHRRSLEGDLPQQHLVKHHAEGVDIHTLGVVPAADLRGHVVHRADAGSLPAVPRDRDELAQAVVANFHIPVVIEDVSGLQVAMDDPAVMQVA